MTLAPETSSKLGDWFRRYTQSSSPAKPTDYFGPSNSSFSPDGESGSADEVTGVVTKFQTNGSGGGLLNSDEKSQPEMSTPDLAPPSKTGAPGTTTKDGVTTLNTEDLTARVVDPANETVEGRIKGMLSDGNEYIEGFKSRAKRGANERGLLNSTMAVSAGEEAAANAALPIASADAATYGKASDYNVALSNQGTMYNAESQNKMSLAQLEAATQELVTRLQTEASMANTARSAAATEAAASASAGASRYASDSSARSAAENRAFTAEQNALNRSAESERTRLSLVNNILNNNDIPPARRAGLLEALGEHDLAGAIYVIDDVGQDIGGPGSGTPGSNGIITNTPTPTGDYGGGG